MSLASAELDVVGDSFDLYVAVFYVGWQGGMRVMTN